MSDRELAAGEWGRSYSLRKGSQAASEKVAWEGVPTCPLCPAWQVQNHTAEPAWSLPAGGRGGVLFEENRKVGPSGGAPWPLQHLSVGNTGKGCVIPTWIPGWPPWQAMWKQQVPGFQGQRELRGHELQPPHPAFSLHQTQPPGYRLCLNTPSDGKLIPVSAARSHP